LKHSIPIYPKFWWRPDLRLVEPILSVKLVAPANQPPPIYTLIALLLSVALTTLALTGAAGCAPEPTTACNTATLPGGIVSMSGAAEGDVLAVVTGGALGEQTLVTLGGSCKTTDSFVLVDCPAVSVDRPGSRVCVRDFAGSRALCHTQTGTKSIPLPVEKDRATACLLSPNACRALLWDPGVPVLRLYDLEDQTELLRLSVPAVAAAFSPDGSRAAYLDVEGLVHVLQFKDATDTMVVQVDWETSRLATFDEGIVVINVADGTLAAFNYEGAALWRSEAESGEGHGILTWATADSGWVAVATGSEVRSTAVLHLFNPTGVEVWRYPLAEWESERGTGLAVSVAVATDGKVGAAWLTAEGCRVLCLNADNKEVCSHTIPAEDIEKRVLQENSGQVPWWHEWGSPVVCFFNRGKSLAAGCRGADRLLICRLR